MKKPISPREAEERFGVRGQHEVMNNGEVRFRLTDRQGNGYVLTVSGPDGAWQKSHYHESRVETYIVEKGWMALAVPNADYTGIDVTIVHGGDVISTRRNKSHNVYLPAGAIIHTVKHGGTASDADWSEDRRLDALTTNLSETEVLAL